MAERDGGASAGYNAGSHDGREAKGEDDVEF